MRNLVNLTTAAALAITQVAAVAPAFGQVQVQPATDQFGRPITRPAPVVRPGFGGGNSGGQHGGNGVQPVRPLPEIQPPRPTPQPVRPLPQPVRPLPQPIRPLPEIQPPRPPGGGFYPPGGNWNGQTIRCESRNGRYNECRANTDGGVRLVRVRGGQCQQGRTWGYRPGAIWVNNGCRADFQLRGGNWNGGGNGGNWGGNNGNNGGGGPSAGAIIGGVAIAGGLIALLAQAGKSSQPANNGGNTAPPLPNDQQFQPPAGPQGPARISADMSGVTPAARPSLQTCLAGAAKQIGATGGSEIRIDRLDEIQPGNGGYRFRFQLKAVYPDETRSVPTFCRATPTTLVELTFG